MRVCYHGTDVEAAKSIRESGFRPGTWFASHLEDALEFGGPHVFRVVFDDPPDEWQFHVAGAVPTERMLSYKKYTVEPVFENRALMKSVFGRTLDAAE